MIYITGDIHGDVSRIIYAAQHYQMKESDILVLLGDVGLNFYGNNNGDQKRKRAANGVNVPLLCIHGNHEMRPQTIPTYTAKRYLGGKVFVEPEYPNIMFAADGEIFNLEGTKAIVIGGAYSVDKFYRLERKIPWFPDEQPSNEIKRYVEEQIKSHKVDVILSHTCPYKYEPVEAFLTNIDQSTVDNSTEKWLDKLEETTEYKMWYCGHWHIDKKIDNMQFLFYDVVTLSGEGYETV